MTKALLGGLIGGCWCWGVERYSRLEAPGSPTCKILDFVISQSISELLSFMRVLNLIGASEKFSYMCFNLSESHPVIYF